MGYFSPVLHRTKGLTVSIKHLPTHARTKFLKSPTMDTYKSTRQLKVLGESELSFDSQDEPDGTIWSAVAAMKICFGAPNWRENKGSDPVPNTTHPRYL